MESKSLMKMATPKSIWTSSPTKILNRTTGAEDTSRHLENVVQVCRCVRLTLSDELNVSRSITGWNIQLKKVVLTAVHMCCTGNLFVFFVEMSR